MPKSIIHYPKLLGHLEWHFGHIIITVNWLVVIDGFSFAGNLYYDQNGHENVTSVIWQDCDFFLIHHLDMWKCQIGKSWCYKNETLQKFADDKRPWNAEAGGAKCNTALTRGLFWCLFPELRSNEGNKHQNNTRVSAETVRHESTYIILFLTRHNKSINDDKNDDLYTSSSGPTRSVFDLIMTSQSIADDVTMTRQLWRDRVNSDI